MKKQGAFFGVLVFFIFVSMSLSSASSIIGSIPNVNLDYDSVGYKLWLWDYYDIDQNEVTRLRFEDPINGRLVDLYPNYATLNLECWEMSYGFEDRGNGWYEDVITFQTYNESCSVDIEFDFVDNGQLSQVFTLSVSGEGSGGQEQQNYNVTGIGLIGLLSYMDFDDNIQDKARGKSIVVSSGTPTYSSTSKYGKSLIVDTSDLVLDVSNMLQGLSSYPNRNNALSFWARFNSGCTPSGLFDTLISGSTSLAPPTFYYTGSTPTAGYIGYTMPFDGGAGSGYESESGDYRDNLWHFFVINQNSTKSMAYLDNVVFGSQYSTNGDFSILKIGDVDNNCNILIDDFIVWNKTLNSSMRTSLYNSGNGLNMSGYNIVPVTTFNVSDINMNQSINYTLNFSSYFVNSTLYSYYLVGSIPAYGYQTNVYYGYHTQNGDYYELWNNGASMIIQSYNRPYNFNLTIFACLGTQYVVCSNKTLVVSIGGDIADVVQLNQFEAIYDLGRDVNYQKIFSGNYFYQYYDKFIFSFPESNFTGVLGNGSVICPDCRGNWNYSIIQEPVLNASYMVILECDITGDYYSYNYLGDLNIIAECGNGEAYYTLTPFNDYGQTIYFTGKNSKGSLSDYTKLIVGNPNYPSGYIPSIENSTSDVIDENVNVFGSILPQDLSDKAKHRILFLVLFIVNGLLIYALVKYGKLCLYVCLVISTILLFVFASADYITLAYPVLSLFITIILLVLAVARR